MMMNTTSRSSTHLSHVSNANNNKNNNSSSSSSSSRQQHAHNNNNNNNKNRSNEVEDYGDSSPPLHMPQSPSLSSSTPPRHTTTTTSTSPSSSSSSLPQQRTASPSSHHHHQHQHHHLIMEGQMAIQSDNSHAVISLIIQQPQLLIHLIPYCIDHGSYDMLYCLINIAKRRHDEDQQQHHFHPYMGNNNNNNNNNNKRNHHNCCCFHCIMSQLHHSYHQSIPNHSLLCGLAHAILVLNHDVDMMWYMDMITHTCHPQLLYEDRNIIMNSNNNNHNNNNSRNHHENDHSSSSHSHSHSHNQFSVMGYHRMTFLHLLCASADLLLEYLPLAHEYFVEQIRNEQQQQQQQQQQEHSHGEHTNTHTNNNNNNNNAVHHTSRNTSSNSRNSSNSSNEQEEIQLSLSAMRRLFEHMAIEGADEDEFKNGGDDDDEDDHDHDLNGVRNNNNNNNINNSHHNNNHSMNLKNNPNNNMHENQQQQQQQQLFESYNLLQLSIKHNYEQSVAILLEYIYNVQSASASSSSSSTSSPSNNSRVNNHTSHTNNNNNNNNKKSETCADTNIILRCTPVHQYSLIHLAIVYRQLSILEYLCQNLDIDSLISMLQMKSFQRALKSHQIPPELLSVLIFKLNTIITLSCSHHSLKLRKRQVSEIAKAMSAVYDEQMSLQQQQQQQQSQAIRVSPSRVMVSDRKLDTVVIDFTTPDRSDGSGKPSIIKIEDLSRGRSSHYLPDRTDSLPTTVSSTPHASSPKKLRRDVD